MGATIERTDITPLPPRASIGVIQSVLEKEAVPISEGDILSYCQMQHLLDEAGDELGERPGNLSIEYVKSSPYLLSFMQHYKEKTGFLLPGFDAFEMASSRAFSGDFSSAAFPESFA